MDRGLLSILVMAGRISPAIWDAIDPQGPVALNPQPLPPVALLALGRLGWVALNPQPLPPKEALVRASAEVARDLSRVVVAAEAAGDPDKAKATVDQAVGHWTGPPLPGRPIPWPHPFPCPEPPVSESGAVKESRVAGALVLAATAERLANSTAREALLEGARRLVEAATETSGS